MKWSRSWMPCKALGKSLVCNVFLPTGNDKVTRNRSECPSTSWGLKHSSIPNKAVHICAFYLSPGQCIYKHKDCVEVLTKDTEDKLATSCVGQPHCGITVSVAWMSKCRAYSSYNYALYKCIPSESWSCLLHEINSRFANSLTWELSLKSQKKGNVGRCSLKCFRFSQRTIDAVKLRLFFLTHRKRYHWYLWEIREENATQRVPDESRLSGPVSRIRGMRLQHHDGNRPENPAHLRWLWPGVEWKLRAGHFAGTCLWILTSFKNLLLSLEMTQQLNSEGISHSR